MAHHPDRARVHPVRLGLAVAGLWLAASCGPHPVPDALVGTWTSSDPRYQDRSLRISPATVQFGTGATTTESFLIEDVASETTDDGSSVHEIRYRDAAGALRSLRLELLRRATPVLRLENHGELWVRSGQPMHPSKEGG